jgi:hypothetical protein
MLDALTLGGGLGDDEIGGIELAGDYLHSITGLAAQLGFTLMGKNREVLYSRVVDSDRPFRLPAGYRSDEARVLLSGSVAVLDVVLAETAQELKQV